MLSEPLRTYANEMGLTNMKRSPLVSYSLKALEATEYAKGTGKVEAFHQGVYRAYWEKQQDIGRNEVLAEVAQEAGLEWDPLRQALEAQTYLRPVVEQFQQGMSLGFTGIPAFLVEGIPMVGLQTLETLRMVAKRVLARREGKGDPEAH